MSVLSEFFRALWPTPVAGMLTFWWAPSRESWHVPLDVALAQDDGDWRVASAKLAVRNEEDRQNLYFGLGLRDPLAGLDQSHQGGKKAVVAIPGFCLDIDIFDEKAHKAKNLPLDDDGALRIIQGMPMPTIVVHSGYGLQIYWCFPQPLVWEPGNHQNADKLMQQFVQGCSQRASLLGYKLDQTDTVQRVWRLPGFKNWKDVKNPKDTQLLFLDSKNRHSVDVLLAAAFPLGIPSPERSRVAVGPAESPPPIGENPTGGSELLLDVISGLRRLVDRTRRELWEKILAGAPFAQPGERDVALRDAAVTLLGFKETEQIDDDDLCKLFAASIASMAAEHNDPENPALTMRDVLTKIRTARRFVAERRKKQDKALEDIARSIVGPPAVLFEDPEDGTSTIARGSMPPVRVEDVEHRGVIVVRTAHFVLDWRSHKRCYSKIKQKDEVLLFARDAWPADSPYSLVTVDPKKGPQPKTLPQVLAKYGTNAENLVYDLSLQRSYYCEQDDTFYDAVAPLRPLEPRFDREIDTWLRLLGGVYVDKVLDWIATVTKLTHPSCCLYLSGPQGAGKSLLPTGLSRLWSKTGPTEYGRIVGSFNEDLIRCPLVFADEKLPKTQDSALAQIREMTASQVRTISRKYQSNATLLGAVRVMLCANNDRLFSAGREDLSTWDLEAVCRRILHVRVPEASTKFLTGLGRSVIGTWLADDLLARHALWLSDNRKVDANSRFLVEGPMTSEHRHLIGAGGPVDAVREWLVLFASNPRTLTDVFRMRKEVPKARIGDGFLYVNVGAVVEFWAQYNGDQQRSPSRTMISRILSNNAVSQHRVINPDGTTSRFNKIEGDFVLKIAEDTGMGDADAIARYLRRTPEENEAPIARIVS